MSKTYTLKVSVQKFEEGSGDTAITCSNNGVLQDSIVVTSSNLTLEEVIKMRTPLIAVLDGFNKEDAE